MNSVFSMRFPIIGSVDLKLFSGLNMLLFKVYGGVLVLHMPLHFFLRYSTMQSLEFIFTEKIFFTNFIKQFINYLALISKVFFLKIKLKGLGYRIKKYNKSIYRFFVGYNHYFYFYTPLHVIIWYKKRNVIMLSLDKIKLNNIFNQLLLLKKLDFFERTNSFISQKKILYLKK